ncbi:MAG: LysM peptidoglycan-binding domain-containing protein [Ferruginibacter sp.]
MIKRFLVTIVLFVITGAVVFAQNITPQEYIEKYKDIAVREMKRMGVPAAITLAQGILETESGNSVLVKKSNNHFGIKCKSSWTGDGVSHDDDAPGECFRTYKNAEDSYRDHSNYLRGSDRYAPLFQLDPSDYKGWAKGLKKAGYATNPKYPEILIRNIELYNLQQYTLAGLKDVPKFDKSKYEDDKEVPADNAVNNNVTEDKATEYNVTVTESTSSINGTKCVFAKKGTSLLAIATNHDIQLSRLLEFNDMETDGILGKDQVIFLQKKAKKGTNDFYTAQPGETLHDVSQKTGVQLEYLAQYNQISKGTVINPGSKLSLQEGKGPMQLPKETVATKTTTAPGKVYEVQPKDGLYSISKKYGVSIQQLKEWNNLTTDTLSIGQKLVVSK